MNTLTNEHRSSIYSQATLAQQYLYNSPDSGRVLNGIAKKFDLRSNPEIYRNYAVTIGDIILGFYRIEDTVPLLQQELELDPRTAALLGADILDFLAPLSDPQWKPPVDNTDTGQSVGEKHAPELVMTPTNQGTYQASAEELVHKSEQDMLRMPLSTVPSYTHPATSTPNNNSTNDLEPPRWRH